MKFYTPREMLESVIETENIKIKSSVFTIISLCFSSGHVGVGKIELTCSFLTNCPGPCLGHSVHLCLGHSVPLSLTLAKVPNIWLTKQNRKCPCQFNVG